MVFMGCMGCMGLIRLDWIKDKENEIGKCKKTGRDLIKINKEFNRPSETDRLLGDASLAKDEIGWEPNIDFDNLVEMMVKKDISRLEDGAVWF